MRRKRLGLSLLCLFVLIVLVYLAIGYHSPKTIPTDVLSRADVFWNSSMLNGTGAYYVNDRVKGSAVSQGEDSYLEAPRQAVFGKSGIVINLQLDNGYLSVEGGPIDIVRGPSYSYELYGREVGQHYFPFRFSWDDSYHYFYSDFYLVKRSNVTKKGELVKE